jgi:hypothetical protein
VYPFVRCCLAKLWHVTNHCHTHVLHSDLYVGRICDCQTEG